MAQMPAAGRWSEAHHKLAQDSGFSSWDEWIEAEEKDAGHTICGAKRRGTDAPCRMHPKPNGRCRYHGGHTPAGVASANWKHGEYSILFPTLPERLQGAAQRAMGDPDLISVRKQIAILTAREEELLGQLNTGESGAAWSASGQVMDALEQAWGSGDANERAQIPQLFATLRHLINQGLADYNIWREYSETVETTRRLRDSELARLKALQSFIEAGRVKEMIGRLLGIMRRHVSDSDTLKNILLEVDIEFGARNLEVDSKA